jgi:hypothetical protein
LLKSLDLVDGSEYIESCSIVTASIFEQMVMGRIQRTRKSGH